MHILCLGINHTTAPVHLRERITFTEDQVRAALSRISCGHTQNTGVEMALISTCNRVEIYATSNHVSFAELETFLSAVRGLTLSELQPNLYRFMDGQSVEHLMEVASGLDSLVLGEPQILGQVTRALELARGVGTAGPLLTRFFHAAIHAGKRVRTETAISRNAASVSSLAAGLCERFMPDLSSAQIVVLGAGEMAELAVEALRKRGAERLTVINRTLERAQILANLWNADAETFENLESALIQADILLSSTGAPHLLVHPPMVASAMQKRPDRPLILIDIAVPRDIDPDVAQIPGIHLYDIDHLNAHLEQSLTKRAAEVPHARAILAEEVAKFLEFLETLEMLPLITDIHQQAESIRNAVLEKTMHRLPDLTESERHHIEAMTQVLVKKLLANPTNHLRAEARSPHAPEIASTTRALFNLQGRRSASHNYQEDASLASTAAD